MNAVHETTLVYSEALLRQAVFAFWRRSIGTGFWGVWVAAALAVMALWLGGSESWPLVMVCNVLIAAVVLAAAVYWVQWRGAVRKLRGMGRAEAVFRAGADGFTMESGLGSTTLPWTAVEALWCFPQVWLLMFSRSQFSTLPVANLSPALQAFLRERVHSHGGHVDPDPTH